MIELRTLDPAAAVPLVQNIVGANYSPWPAYAADRAQQVASMTRIEDPAAQSFVLVEDGIPRAHICAFTDAHLPGIGLVGYFECAPAYDAIRLLDAATEHLYARECARVRGPIDGTTWQRFRVCVAGDGSPFSSEPYTPLSYADAFHRAGFTVAQRNLTTVANTSGAESAATCEAQIAQLGFTLSDPSTERPETLLPELAAFLHAQLADTWCFVPLAANTFSALFADGVAAHPAFTPIVRHPDGSLAAVLWCYPDAYDARNIIAKIMVVDPAARGRGLGSVLYALVRARAAAQGFTQMFASTMRDDNSAIQSLVPDGAPYRRYEAYERAR